MKEIFLAFILLAVYSNLYSQTTNLILLNGCIYTLNPKNPFARAVVIEGTKIVFVGSEEDALKFRTVNSKLIDLKGKFALPGFIDNHTHFISGGFYLTGVNLRNAKSKQEFQSALKDYTKHNSTKWVVGGDWDHEAWNKAELPTKEWVDEFTPNTPVFVNRFDGHMGLANSYALKLAGIDKSTKDPEGGLIVKDKNGEPTGILKDNAMKLIYSIIPEPSEEETRSAMNAALDEAKKNGVTSIQDMTYKNDLVIFQKYEKENLLTCRIYCRLPIENYQFLIDNGIQYNYGGDMLKIGSLKAFVDGSLGSSTALFFNEYENEPGNFGLAMDILLDGSLKKWALEADKNRLQLSVHAIGDKANNEILNIFEEIVTTNKKWDRRFRIEHAQHLLESDIPRFKELGVIASVQPYHLIDDGVWAEKRIGPDRLKYTYPFKSLIDAGAIVCFGSDWSVAPLNPILGIYAAVTRRTLDDKNPDGWLPEQKISVEEAIKCYTINNAYASFEENLKGSIEHGKLADIIVLSDNLLEIEPEKIKNVKVDMTIFNGNLIFER